MKKILFIIIIAWVFQTGCSGSGYTDVSGEWKKPGYTGKKFKKILVVAISNDQVKRTNVENAIVNELAKNQINAVSGSVVLDYPSLEIEKGKIDSAKIADVKNKLESLGYDGVIVVSLLDVKEKTNYVPGMTYTTGFYGYGGMYPYRGFYGYWPAAYNVVHTPGYYVNTTYIYLEARLFDLTSDELLWSVQTSTSNPSNIKDFAASYAQTIVNDAISSNIIK